MALCAPMFGIVMRLPDWMVRHILDGLRAISAFVKKYALGTGRRRALPLRLTY